MLGAAGLLTVVTLLGLVAGLGREWLLVASWGAGAHTDAFLVAMFIPEAVRTTLGGGLLSSAAMALWQHKPMAARPGWLGTLSLAMTVLSVATAALVCLGAPWCIRGIGPGLHEAEREQVTQSLRIMAWCIPPMVLQALWSVPLQASGRFVMAGLSSLIYNLPAVIYLACKRQAADPQALACAFVLGATATSLPLAVAMHGLGLRPHHWRWDRLAVRELRQRVSPLLGSALSGQGLLLLERMVASWLGEGAVTMLNLARKLVNLPLVALMSVNQVVLGLMSKGGHAQRLPLLRQGLALNTLITTPAAVGLLLSAQAIVSLLFPKVTGTAMLGPLLGWYAIALVVAGWNTLLARYNHASGDTRLPFVCETSGNACQAVLMPLLAWHMGALGLAFAVLIGVSVNGALLLHFNRLWRAIDLPTLLLAAAVPLVVSALALLPHWPSAPLPRLELSSVVAAGWMLLLAVGLRPWRQTS